MGMAIVPRPATTPIPAWPLRLWPGVVVGRGKGGGALIGWQAERFGRVEKPCSGGGGSCGFSSNYDFNPKYEILYVCI